MLGLEEGDVPIHCVLQPVKLDLKKEISLGLAQALKVVLNSALLTVNERQPLFPFLRMRFLVGVVDIKNRGMSQIEQYMILRREIYDLR